jgi:signal transduction histidine kinase
MAQTEVGDPESEALPVKNARKANASDSLTSTQRAAMIYDRDVPKKPKILIVEDETITAHHLQRILTKLGYDVVGVAADGQTAVRLIGETNPALLLADVGLEGEIDGVEVAARARDGWNVPTVFLTAYSDPETMRRARVTEPYGFLVKPFAEQDLHATIEIALQQKDLAASRQREVQAAAHILGLTQEELNAVTARLLSAQEQERERIARDLHDDVVQRLALLQMDLERLSGRFPAPIPDAIKLQFKTALEQLAVISKDLRDLSHRLHPQILNDLGLEAALRALCETFEEHHSVMVRFSTRNVPAHIPVSTSLALYRIVQESLQNIAKHACADSVSVALIGGARSIELSIRDNGRGFDASTHKHGSGLGLVNMAQRAKIAGGSFEIKSHPNQGTGTRVSIPLETQEL